MATILVDAKVYIVDDEEALCTGVVYDHLHGCSEPVWNSDGDNYMEAKVVSEYIRGRRFIRRPDGTKIIGLSKDVHEALEWHVEAFDNMEKELSYSTNLLGISNRRVENLTKQLMRTQSENQGYRIVLEELQSLSLWGRIVRVFKGY